MDGSILRPPWSHACATVFYFDAAGFETASLMRAAISEFNSTSNQNRFGEGSSAVLGCPALNSQILRGMPRIPGAFNYPARCH